MPKFIDLTGQRFGRLTVIGRGPDKVQGVPRWECLCDCGKTKHSRSDTFKNSLNASCGCYNIELATKRLTTHGRSRSPEYRTWVGMHNRCYKPSCAAYYKYGARGISVCKRWKKFENFFSDMGEKPSPSHSIDRIDGTKNYTPGNCRWATTREQQLNLKTNVRLTHDGKSLTMGEWAPIVGLKAKTIEGRIRLGWSTNDALTMPLNYHHRHRKKTG